MTPTGMVVMLAVEPVDMRRSFDGLAAHIKERFSMDPRAQRMMFAFVNRQRTTVKVLWGDQHGWFILGRRLDGRVVALPRDIPAGASSVRVDAQALAVLLEGVAVRARQTPRDVARAARDAVEKERMTTRNEQHSKTDQRS